MKNRPEVRLELERDAIRLARECRFRSEYINERVEGVIGSRSLGNRFASDNTSFELLARSTWLCFVLCMDRCTRAYVKIIKTFGERQYYQRRGHLLAITCVESLQRYCSYYCVRQRIIYVNDTRDQISHVHKRRTARAAVRSRASAPAISLDIIPFGVNIGRDNMELVDGRAPLLQQSHASEDRSVRAVRSVSRISALRPLKLKGEYAVYYAPKNDFTDRLMQNFRNVCFPRMPQDNRNSSFNISIEGFANEKELLKAYRRIEIREWNWWPYVKPAHTNYAGVIFAANISEASKTLDYKIQSMNLGYNQLFYEQSQWWSSSGDDYLTEVNRILSTQTCLDASFIKLKTENDPDCPNYNVNITMYREYLNAIGIYIYYFWILDFFFQMTLKRLNLPNERDFSKADYAYSFAVSEGKGPIGNIRHASGNSCRVRRNGGGHCRRKHHIHIEARVQHAYLVESRQQRIPSMDFLFTTTADDRWVPIAWAFFLLFYLVILVRNFFFLPLEENVKRMKHLQCMAGMQCYDGVCKYPLNYMKLDGNNITLLIPYSYTVILPIFIFFVLYLMESPRKFFYLYFSHPRSKTTLRTLERTHTHTHTHEPQLCAERDDRAAALDSQHNKLQVYKHQSIQQLPA
ncbi:unnamed protein product [Trichogramma brassicae]|uniref:Uncharacterized protein n=1 Tax=Trichogramma brassicae TaxID=86971 RepID=A0A6H5I1M1_9HYME|nr:unnamed protein product [Trichogramma brassicae]